MRTLNQDPTATQGAEPIVLVRVVWGNLLTGLYSDKDYAGHSGRILSFSGVRSQKTADGFGAVSTCTLTLDDFDNELRTIADGYIVEGSRVYVSYYFIGVAGTDTEIFRGKISGPITWSEGDRTLSFSIDSDLEGVEIGYSIEEDNEMNCNTDDAVGKPWPLVFGEATHSPTVLVQQIPTVKLSHECSFGNLKIEDELWLRKDEDDDEDVDEINMLDSYEISSMLGTRVESDEVNWIDDKKLHFDKANVLPVDAVIKLEIDGVIFEGKTDADGTSFGVTKANAVKWRNVTAGLRPVGDNDFENPKVLWLAPAFANVDLASHHCFWFNDSSWAVRFFGKAKRVRTENICVKQEGLKCWFKYPFKMEQCSNAIKHPKNPTWCLPQSGFRLSEVKALAENGLLIELNEFLDNVERKLAQRRRTKRKGDNKSVFSPLLRQIELIKYLKSSFWGAKAGTIVRQWEGTVADIYVANMVSSTEVLAVYGLYTPTEGKPQILAPIPKAFYTVNLVRATVLDAPAPQTVTTIEFARSLDSYKDQHWERKSIFVTLKSTVSSNTAEQIKWLFDTYTDFTTDTTSFASVAVSIAKFPSNFTLMQTQNVLTLAKEMAWQSRCGLLLDGPTVKIKYLSLEPTTAGIVLSQALTEFKTLEHQFTESHDITTVATGAYRRTYAPEPHDKELKTVHRINVYRYGTRKRDMQFFIYNNKSYVRKSLWFWLNRWARSWRLVECNTFSDAMALEVFDCISVQYTDSTLVTANTKGIIEAIDHDYHQKRVKLKVWLPIETGSAVQHADAWIDNTYEAYDDPSTEVFTGDVTTFETSNHGDVEEIVREIRQLEHESKELAKVTWINPKNPVQYLAQMYPDGPFAEPDPYQENDQKYPGKIYNDGNAHHNLKIGDWIEVDSNQDGVNACYRFTLPVQLAQIVEVKTNGMYSVKLIDTNDDDPATYQYAPGDQAVALPPWATNYEPDTDEGEQILKIDAINIAELLVPGYGQVPAYHIGDAPEMDENLVSYKGLLEIGTIVEVRHYAAYKDLDDPEATGNDFWWFDRTPPSSALLFGCLTTTWAKDQDDVWHMLVNPCDREGNFKITDMEVKISIGMPQINKPTIMSNLQSGNVVAYLPYKMADGTTEGLMVGYLEGDDVGAVVAMPHCNLISVYYDAGRRPIGWTEYGAYPQAIWVSPWNYPDPR